MKTGIDETNTNESTDKFARLRSLQNRKLESAKDTESAAIKTTTAPTGKRSSSSTSSEKPSSEILSSSPRIRNENATPYAKAPAITEKTTPEGNGSASSLQLSEKENPDVKLLDVRKEIWATHAKLKRGEITPKEANQTLKHCNMVMRTIKLELDVMDKFE